MIDMVQLRVNLEAEKIISAIAFHEHEITQQVKEGVDMAIKDMGTKIAIHAAECAQKEILNAVSRYFTLGPGNKIIYDMVGTIMDKVVDGLTRSLEEINGQLPRVREEGHQEEDR